MKKFGFKMLFLTIGSMLFLMQEAYADKKVIQYQAQDENGDTLKLYIKKEAIEIECGTGSARMPANEVLRRIKGKEITDHRKARKAAHHKPGLVWRATWNGSAKSGAKTNVLGVVWGKSCFSEGQYGNSSLGNWADAVCVRYNK